MAVDWEQRVNFDRLRTHRLDRTKAALEASDLGAMLLFDPNNLRYVTSTAIGTWERDKNIRFALVPRGGEDPILWDFGSAARHHQLYCPWLPESSWRAWVPPMRGAMPDETGVPDDLARMVREELRELGLEGEPLGMDVPDMTTLLALQRAGLHIVDSQPVMLEARKIKSDDELALLEQAAGMVDAAYDTIYRMLRPGVRENEVVAEAMKVLFELGSEHVEAINAISGDRCNPHPHTFSDRVLRPGDQAFFDIIHSFMGYRTCYYRTFNIGYATPAQLDAYKQCREWLDDAIACVRPGGTTAEIADVWPTAKEIGMKDERAAFGLQFGHGLGVGLYEAPMISRLHSFEDPVEIEVGMVFALETYCAAGDGRSAARIEEEVIVTAQGPEVITRFPADELLVAGRNYVRGADFLDGRLVRDELAGV
ncbi:MAG TPA: Xaa-Pro peptidase family protein [Gaiellaceae bacterium]|nr:Xaa-Pro peptidase family protein [Gaiellaceae bacterium]